MKLKKGILLTALTLMTVSVMGMFNNVQAATSKTLSIKALRKSGFGYQVVNNSTKYIWKIYDTNDKNETFYCIKGGPGFGSSNMGQTITPTEYTQSFDMKNPDEITSKYLNAILDPDSKQYERLMWVLDQCYVQPKKNASDDEITIAQESKRNLLNAVDEYIEKHPGIYDNPSYIYDKLTDILDEYEEDIDAIQQLAVWYYTNDDDYHVNRNPTIKMNSVKDVNGNYQALDINDDEDAARIHAMNALYAYLTQTPQASGFSYDYANGAKNANPQFEDTTVEIEENGDRIIVGPYRINENSENANYSLRGTITDGNNDRITDVIFLDRNKQELRTNPTLENLKEIVEQDFYISLPSTVNQTNIEFYIEGNCFKTEVTYWSVENPGEVDQPIVQIEKTNRGFDDEKTVSKEPVPEIVEFDLALRKFITSIAGKTLTGADSRVPTISDSELRNLANKEATGINTTSANKVHRKDALTVKTGDKVVYTIRIYNEGDVDGWATEVTDHLPEGLKFVPVAQSSINQKYGWTNPSGDGKTIVTSYLASTSCKLNAFNKETYNLDYEDLQIECEVIATPEATTKHLKNIAEITAHKDINGNTGNNLTDRDSRPNSLTSDDINNYGTTSKQDDDDFEQLILQPKPETEKSFDLALRKFIVDVKNPNSDKSNVLQSREPQVVVKPLLEGKTTATYNHTKEPVSVSNGDIVTYTIRVYNEGEVDGYVTEITDHLPKQLEFIIDDELNKQYGWTVVEGSNGRTVKTDITSPNTTHSASRDIIYATRRDETDKVLLRAFEYEENSKLDYIDVKIRCRVKDDISLFEKITNIADITDFTDSQGNKVEDRDSQEDNVTLPKDETLPEYKDQEINSKIEYIEGQQDDDDFEKLVLRKFDLALRKFITGVANGEKVEDITNRAPVFVNENGKYTYEHTKEPVEVANGNTVIYTLRIFNEGNVSGYATKVKDDLPEGLEFLPENIVNTAFNWKMYKEDGTETKDVKEAKYIETDFLSKEKEKEDGANLIKAFNPETMTMPDYKDLKIAFKVTEPNTSDRIIINQAQISDDSDEEGNPVDDIDSVPDEWNEGEDDQDIEKIKVKYFDLSLKKWVTEAIVTVDGKTKVTKSGHTGDENPEPPMKVEIQNGKINSTTVKFRFNIKVTNEGEIAGYATELIDYIPQGLKFDKKDNPKWKEENGKVTTDQLKDKLLKPGESATVDIVLTWINGKNNMGQKVNWAEIYKDKNEYDSPDIDSTPGNNVKGEDDIDQAPVLLSPATGSEPMYIGLALICVTMITGGIFLIKKYVIS